jgi:hypothetical protein
MATWRTMAGQSIKPWAGSLSNVSALATITRD